ncbi:MAG: hypothetical protein HYT36_02970 [Candidatus Staskawiczbacteria bacterium]|nr:hypothetical protein [Candidatus Staskawiczbacteria bacterium]
MFHNFKKNNQKGQILIQIIIFGSIAILIFSGLIGWATVNIQISKREFNRQLAIQIAEAGIDYYRWHLAHAPQDFQDGTGQLGPYTHIYYNKDNQPIGRFILSITPPPIGSTLVAIRSEGRVDEDANVKRTIETQLGIPSWAKYSYVSNSYVWFGETEPVVGLLHSNAGIRVDSAADNLVTSAAAIYDDPDHSGANEFGVHTHKAPIDPLPPAAVPNRADVFMAGRQFPVPAVDFAGLSSDLSQLKTDAKNNGRYFAASGSVGYQIVLKTNDTFDIYKVTSLYGVSGGCSTNAPNRSSYSVKNKTLLQSNQTFPSNGIIFVEDHVFVEGQINTARLTIASGRFPESQSTNTNIIVNNNLLYTNFDGSDTIGLIAQGNFHIGLKSADALEVDAAILAKNGSTIRYYYNSGCGAEYLRDSLTLRGMSGSYLRGNAFAWVSCGTCATVISGYSAVTTVYDGSLLYTPPPSFPLTSDQYVTLSWKEIK